jgi:hypothetical protein
MGSIVRATLSLALMSTPLTWIACGGSDTPSPTDPGGPPGSTDQVAEETFSLPVSATAESTLTVRGINGGVDVTGGAAPGSVTIAGVRRVESNSLSDAQSRLAGLQVQVTTLGSEIIVETDQPADTEGRNYIVNYTISVPDGVDVSVRNTNGGVTLTGIAGNVVVDLTNGTISSQVTLPRDGTIEESTVNGDIELRIPASTSAQVTANVTNGEIRVSGLTIEDQNAAGNSLEGTLGDGRGTISIRTVNGSITLTGI